MGAEPALRAAVAKDLLRGAFQRDGLEGVLREQVGDAVDAVEHASLVTWIPIEHLVALIKATHAALSPETFDELYRQVSRDSARLPFLRGFGDGVTRMIGKDRPMRLLQYMPRVYKMVHRECGRMTVEENPDGDDDQVVVEIVELTRALRTESYAVAYRAGLTGTLDALGREGRVRLNATALQDGHVRYDLRWDEERDAG